MSRATSPKKPKSTKMTDLNNSGDKSPAQLALPSVSPASGAVDKAGAPLALTRNEYLDAEAKAYANTYPKGVGAGGTSPATTVAKGTYVAAPQHDIPEKVDPLLVDMLCWPRNHGSPEEIAFTGWLMDYITKDLKKLVTMREEGAFSVTIPLEQKTPEGQVMHSTTLFSCHVDTVDTKMTDSKTRKKLTYDPSFGTIALDSQSAGNCLGADDSAGIWLMLKMIEAGTPGTYLFHRGEEVGGISAKAIERKASGWLGGFSVAVAFDRKDTGDIVTVQGGQRCASPKFAGRLAGMLDAFGFKYQESLTGSYTDVKEYRKIIAECVNLSCGYDGAHSRNETLDYAHLAAMAAALPKVEWETLPIDRDPKAKDPEPAYQNWKGSRGFGRMDKLFDDDEERQWGARAKAGKKKTMPMIPVGKLPAADFDPGTSFSGMSMEEIRDAVEDDATWAIEGIIDLMRQNAKLRADNAILNELLGL